MPRRAPRPLAAQELETRVCPVLTPDAFEVDDTWQAARPHPTTGAAHVHSIHTDGDVDWIRFSLAAPADVVVQTDGPDGDTRLSLYAAADPTEPIASNDDGGAGYFSRLALPLAAGDYLAAVDEYGRNDTIERYTLAVRAYAAADLTVNSARVGGADHLAVGGRAAVSWTGKNRGPGTADPGHDGDPSWTDRVYLSADETLDPADVALGDWEYDGRALARGRTYRAADTVDLPADVAWAGKAAYLLVQSDADGAAADADRGNNVRAVTVRFDPLVELQSPLPGRLADGRTAVTFAALGYDFGRAAVLDIAVDRDAKPRNGAARWVASNQPVTNQGDPVSVSATLADLPPRAAPYYVWARLRDPATGAATYTAPVPLFVGQTAAQSDDALGDTVGGSGFEVFGVDAGRLGRDLIFRVRTNFQPDRSGSSTGGDVRLVVGDRTYGLAVNSHAVADGRQLRAGHLYARAAFRGGTIVEEVPTFIDDFTTHVSGRSAVRVTATPGRPWAYELSGRVDLRALDGYESGDDVQVGWAMYCGNDTDEVDVRPEDPDFILASAGFDGDRLAFGYGATGTTGPVQVSVFESADDVLGPDDILRDTQTVNPAPNASGAGSFPRPPAPLTSHYILVVADPDNVVTEANEFNNTQVMFTSVDLTPKVLADDVVPTDEPLLHLKHLFGGEKLNVPVTILNQGTDPAVGRVTVSLFLADRPNLTGTKIAIGDNKKTPVAVNLQSGQSLKVTIPAKVPTGQLKKETRYYIVAKIEPAGMREGNGGNPQTANNVGATEFGLMFIADPSQWFHADQYFDVVRKVYNGYDPYAPQGVSPPPADGLHYTATFETTGGYDNPRLDPYIDTPQAQVPTIGIGLNLTALIPTVKQGLAAAVRAYFPTAVPADFANKTDNEIIQSLIARAFAGNHQPVHEAGEAQRLYRLAYDYHTERALRLVGGPQTYEVTSVLIDIQYNSAGGLAGYTSLLKVVNAAEYDGVLAGFYMFDSKRTRDLGTHPNKAHDRIVANYQYLLAGQAERLGRFGP